MYALLDEPKGAFPNGFVNLKRTYFLFHNKRIELFVVQSKFRMQIGI